MRVSNKEAKSIILDSVGIKDDELVTIDEAYGRVLAEDLKARYNIPEVRKSAIDGYALNFSDNSKPKSFKVKGESRAGDSKTKEIKEGEAVFVMTGAIVPDSAKCMVRVEDTTQKDGEVLINCDYQTGDMINEIGCEVKESETILKKGEMLDYRKVAMISDIGYYQIKVFQKPKIGIVITGDEVKESWQESEKSGVKNSNFYILKGMLKGLADITYYGIAKDEPEALERVFAKALENSDILLSSGGVSKGKYDFTKDVASKIGLGIKFNQTAIKPGKPLVFGLKEKKLFFGLPGYPSALLLNANEYLLPAVRKMCGINRFENRLFKVIVDGRLKAKKGVTNIIRASLEFKDGKVFAKSTKNQQTSNFLSMMQSSAFVIIDEERESLDDGDLADCYFI